MKFKTCPLDMDSRLCRPVVIIVVVCIILMFSKELFCCINPYITWSGLDIGLVGPVARGASRFENLLAPQKTYWPGGPVDLKTYWPPKKLTGPPKN